MRAYLLADALDVSLPSNAVGEAMDFSSDLVPFLPNYSVTVFAYASSSFLDAELTIQGRDDPTDDNAWEDLAVVDAAGASFVDIQLKQEIRIVVTPGDYAAGTVSVTLLGN